MVTSSQMLQITVHYYSLQLFYSFLSFLASAPHFYWLHASRHSYLLGPSETPGLSGGLLSTDMHISRQTLDEGIRCSSALLVERGRCYNQCLA